MAIAKHREEEHIELSSRVGSILQKERKARKLSIKDVAQGASISVRYIEALENDDFSQFPGETYAIGFLSNYADYLSLDRSRLITLFRQQKVDTSPSPLEELTRPNSVFSSLRFMTALNKRKLFWGFSFLSLFFAVVFVFDSLDFRAMNWHLSNWGAPEPYCSGERELRVSNLPLPGSSPRSETLSLQPPDALRVSAENLVLKFCLSEVKSENLTSPIGIFHVRVDAKQNYRFQILEGYSHTLSSDIKEFAGLGIRIKFTPTVLNDFSARIELETEKPAALLAEGDLEQDEAGLGEVDADGAGEDELGQDKTEQDKAGEDQIGQDTEADKAPAAFQNEIQVGLEFIKDSYMEWTQDGRTHRGRLVQAGKTHTLEARDRLEIKLGNAGGVRIRRPNLNPRIAGPEARIVKLEYRRIPDPLDPSISRIKEFVEIVK